MSSGTGKLKVLFIPAWYPPAENRWSPAGTFVREHVLALAPHEDVAVLNYHIDRHRRFSGTVQFSQDEGVPTWDAASGRGLFPFPRFPRLIVNLQRLVRRIILDWGRPDLIHTQDQRAYPAWKACRHLGIPFVISQHATVFMRGTLTRKFQRESQRAFSAAKLVFLANKFGSADLERHGIQVPTRWLPNALNTEVFRPGVGERREPWLLHVSVLSSQKRFPDIVAAFAELLARGEHAILQVLGDGLNRKNMETVAKECLPAGSYHFHGAVPKQTVAEFMRKSRGLVFPSEFETFGCVLMEALACECPILTTRVGGIPAVVREDEALNVEVGDIQAIAAGMRRLLHGTHGLDLPKASHRVREAFNRDKLGALLHTYHLEAAGREETPVPLYGNDPRIAETVLSAQI